MRLMNNPIRIDREENNERQLVNSLGKEGPFVQR